MIDRWSENLDDSCASARGFQVVRVGLWTARLSAARRARRELSPFGRHGVDHRQRRPHHGSAALRSLLATGKDPETLS